MQHLRWNELLNREDGFSALLDRILKYSAVFQNRTLAHNKDLASSTVETRMPPTKDDYLLWQVHCRVSPKDDCFQ
jgi:hypothetical protein